MSQIIPEFNPTIPPPVFPLMAEKIQPALPLIEGTLAATKA